MVHTRFCEWVRDGVTGCVYGVCTSGTGRSAVYGVREPRWRVLKVTTNDVVKAFICHTLNVYTHTITLSISNKQYKTPTFQREAHAGRWRRKRPEKDVMLTVPYSSNHASRRDRLRAEQ